MTVTGTTGDDLLVGTPGDDTIEGLDGNDTLIGGAGIDSLNGGDGIDTVDFSDEAAGIVVDLDINSAGGAGTPSQDGAILDALPAAGGVPIEEVDDIENIIGSDFDDFLLGNNEVNNIQGGLGDDSIHGFGGADTLDGGDGIDTLLFTAAGAGVNIDLAAGTTGPNITTNFENANGSAFDDTITGDDGDNVLIGNAGSDILYGGDGDDTLVSDGLDAIDGGAGIDTVDFSVVEEGIAIDLSAPPAEPPADPPEPPAEPSVTILNDGSVDLSGSGADPTLFELAIGTSQISNQVVNAAAAPDLPAQDVDIFTIVVPEGAILSEVVLSEFEGANVGFLALVEGDTFPADALAAGADQSTFIGQGLFGDGGVAATGTNILPGILDDDFDGDAGLGPGSFTFLFQQLGASVVDYTLDFIVEAATPDPVDSGVTVLNDGSVDLSGSGAAPTLFDLEIGTSQISNQVVNAAAVPDLPAQDVDIFTITVPEGAILTEVILSDFVSIDDVGFLALVEGDTFPADALAAGADQSAFIGQGLFGDGGAAATGTNILPGVATGFDGDAGLGPGSFTFLFQQLGANVIDYTLDFVVEAATPDPIDPPVDPDVTVLNDGSVDLSGSGAAPTAFDLEIGTSQISNQVANAAADPAFPPQDVDIFSITVPEGAVLSEVVLSDFISTDDLGFLALVEGDTFPADALASDADPSTFIGLANFGNDVAPNAVTGTNILPALAAGGGLVEADAFTPFNADAGLGPGTFTFLVQQLGDATIDYTLDFIVEAAVDAPLSLVGVENIIGSAGDDTLVGDDGDNTFSGGAGVDSLNGGEGIDTVDFSNETAGIIVDLDINSAGGTGTPSQDGAILDAPPAAGGAPLEEVDDFENIIGSDFNDGLFGNNEVNIIEGGLGDDTIHGFGGADTLDGGEGTDTLLFSAAGAGVNIDLAAETAGPNTTTNFENATGSANDDTITGDDGDNVLVGNAGDDILTGGLGNNTLNGGEGTDTAIFAAAQEAFDIADNGDGSLSVASNDGGGISDTLIDIELVSFNGVVVDAEDLLADDVVDDDVVIGGLGDDTIIGGVDIDAINDIIVTGAGDDTVSLSTAPDAADNIVLVGSGADEVAASQDDIISGGSGDDTLDAIDGNSGNRISGGDGNDTLILGTAGGDRFLGGDGDDTFLFGEGGAGANILSGGSGADTFAVSPGEVPTEANIITDFDVAEDTFAGVDFADVTLEGSDVLIDGSAIATLLGVDATTLTEANFGGAAPTAVVASDLGDITLNDPFVGPLGPVVPGEFTTETDEVLGSIASAAFTPGEDGIVTFVNSVTLGSDGFTSFEVDAVPGFTGTAGFVFDDITGLPTVDGLTFGDALTAGGTGTEVDFDIELTDDESLVFSLPEGAEAFFGAGETITFFYQSEFGPVGPLNTAILTLGDAVGSVIAPLPGPPA